MSSSSSSGEASDTKTFKFDAFLSFRGPDTRKTFTDHLFAALNRKGIFTFRDNEELERGEAISDQLLKAIEDSRSAIVVLSPNYASSSWCLDELLKILECKEAAGMIVLPIFYNVEPKNVRHQLGSFADAFEKFEKRGTGPAKLHKWREALKAVADLSGRSSANEHEARFIEDIVNHLFTTLGIRFSGIPSELVGIDARLQVVEEALDIKLDRTRSVGIAGMGGSGKTTLARVVYERMLHLFDAGSFLRDVREVSKNGSGLVTLQKQLLRETLGKRDVKPYNKEDGVAIIRSRLQSRKILVVLDDVDDVEQVSHLVGDLCWFRSGSRIIITSRDKHLLNKVNYIYEVKLLDDNESLGLFQQHAFNNDQPAGEEFDSLSLKFCEYCHGLPLALKVLGSLLTGRSIAGWKGTLNQLNDMPNVKILDILKISYDGLDEIQKKVFLFVACFFHGYTERNVVDLVHYLGYFPDINMAILKERSLTYTFEERVGMHDLLRELGKNIVHRECTTEAGRRSLLWRLDDIDHVLDECTGTEAVEGLVLDVNVAEHQQHPMPDNLNGLAGLTGLKLLMVRGWDVKCSEDSKFLSNGIRVLCWNNYPFGLLPSGFRPRNLHCLVLPSSLIRNLQGDSKIFAKLERLDLQYSKNLTEIPDLTNLPNLKFLSLEGCAELIEVHSSQAHHANITRINLKGCTSLTRLPETMKFPQLEFLSVVGCSRLERFPEISGPMGKLEFLHLDGTPMSELPLSIGFLIGLVMFTAANCRELRSLPDTFADLEFLERVNLGGCISLEKLPPNFGQLKKLKELHLDEKAMAELPKNFEFPGLEYFHIEGCSNFERFVEIFGCMEKLKFLHLDGVAVAELSSFLKYPSTESALLTWAFLFPRELFSRICPVKPTPAKAIKFLLMEDLFLKPHVAGVPTLSGCTDFVGKLRANEAGMEELRQCYKSFFDKQNSILIPLTFMLRGINDRG